ncbi:S41 family peptidase [Caldiplasma sukawensis]
MNPDIYENKVVFISKDSIWEYDISYGKLSLLVKPEGVPSNVRYYKNGKRIVYRVLSGRDISSADLYTYDITERKEKRLTYLGGKSVNRRMFTDIAGFTSDGKIVFSTDLFKPFTWMVFPYVFDNEETNFKELPLGAVNHYMEKDGDIFIGRNTIELYHFKGYKGGQRGKIWRGNISAGFRKIVDIRTHVSSPVICNDRLYFVTDLEGSGEIYSTDLEGKDLKRHTSFHNYYPRHLNSYGDLIVFSMEGNIYLMNVKTSECKKLDIPMGEPDDARLSFKASEFLENINFYDRSKLSIVSRGQSFVTDYRVESRIKIDEKLRIRNSVISGDMVYYILGSTKGDMVKSFSLKNHESKEYRGDFGNIYKIKISKSGKYIVFSNDRFELMMINTENGNTVMVDRSRVSYLNDFSISDDEKFITYSYHHAQAIDSNYSFSKIRIFNISERKTYDLSSDTGRDFSPEIDPSGRYLYYLSERSLDPVRDDLNFNFAFNSISKPFVIPLKKNDVNPFTGLAELNVKAEEYDLSNAIFRASPLPLDNGDYASIISYESGIYILKRDYQNEFLSSAKGDPGTLYKYDLKERKMKKVEGDITRLEFSYDKKDIFFSTGEKRYFIRSIEKEEKESVDVDKILISSNMREDFLQMYDEAWQLARDNYWNEKKANNVSERIYEKYRKLAERCSTRFELSNVIQEMQGEYGTSHSYENDGFYTTINPLKFGRFGADFTMENGKCVLKKLHMGDPSNENEKSPFYLSNIIPEEGWVLESVEGERVTSLSKMYEIFSNRNNQMLQMTFRDGNGESKRVFVKPMEDDKFIRYRSWVENNRRYVHEKTGGRVGYIHIPDMGINGLREFFRLFVSEISKDAIIIDVRYNGGGFVSQLVLRQLHKGRIGYDKPRRGILSPYPANSVKGPMIAITNEYAASDGDIFSHSFKLMKLGKLIGERTWGGVVGIYPKRKLIDGTTLTQPEFSYWFKDVGWGVENWGAEPDEEVLFTPIDYYNGKDPQLDYAIGQMLEELKKFHEDLPEETSR